MNTHIYIVYFTYIYMKIFSIFIKLHGSFFTYLKEFNMLDVRYYVFRKILEREDELFIIGNIFKSLEVSEEKVDILLY